MDAIQHRSRGGPHRNARRLEEPAGERINTLGAAGNGRQMAGTLMEVLLIGEVPQSGYDARGIPKSGPEKAIIEVAYRAVYRDRWRVTSDTVVPQAR